MPTDPTQPDISTLGGGTQPTTPVQPAPIASTTIPPVNTSQPSAQNVNATPYTGNSIVDALNQGGQASDFASRTALATKEGIQGYTGTADQNTQLLNTYKQGLANAKASGAPAPTDSGDGRTGVTNNLPPPQPTDTSNPAQVSAVLADDKAHQQYIDDYKASQTSSAQNETLTQQYNDLSKQADIPGLDTQLMNMKNVMDGSEQDIRNEITKSGGFATNSQVMALTAARNTTLQKNYNTLLQTRDDAVNNINTQIGLSEKDKAIAIQQIDSQLNFDKQNIDYADKALTNAQDVYKNMQQTEGWDGIYKAALASGDPTAIQKINSTMGNGFDLASMAKQDEALKATTAQTTALDQAQKEASIKSSNASTNKTIVDTQIAQEKANEDAGIPNPAKANAPGFNEQGVKYTNSSATTELQNEIKSQGLTGTRHLLAPADYNQMKAWWTLQGLKDTDFDNIFGGYKDTGKAKSQYN